MTKKYIIPMCDSCESRFDSIFAELKPSDLAQIAQNKCGNIYKKDQIIFYEGHVATGLYCINKGRVKVYKMNHEGKQQIIRLAKEGDIIGYSSMITGDAYSSSAEALEDALVCFIPKSVFLNIVQSNSDLFMKLIQLLSRDMKETENRFVTMAQNTVRERLAETLLMLKEFCGHDDFGLNIVMSRQDIANIVGTSTETTIRLLADFKDEKLIDFIGKKIKILNQRALIKTANLSD
ncbi:Crp/Fnr family transcriptional regulator [bacterium]|nr:MAG: Crp/Fnr family transcriptional regulator [bacterium]